MARLSDLISEKNTKNPVTKTELEESTVNDSLVEALTILIDMISEGALTDEETTNLDETIAFITESIVNGEEDLNEKRMSASALLKARKYRLKNKSKLAMIARKKANCQAKLKLDGKAGYSCNSKGQVHKVDLKRSKASRMGARSRD